jgi:hypothetical protein
MRRLISADLNSSYGTERLPSASQRSLLCFFFSQTAWSNRKNWTILFLGEQIQWVQTSRHPVVSLCAQLTCPPHSTKTERRQHSDGVFLALLKKRSGLPFTNGVLFSEQLIIQWRITRVRSGGPLPETTHGDCSVVIQTLTQTHFVTLLTDKFKRICGFQFPPTASER